MKAIQPAIEFVNVLFLEQIQLWPVFLPHWNRLKTAFLQLGFGFQKLLFPMETHQIWLPATHFKDAIRTSSPSMLDEVFLAAAHRGSLIFAGCSVC